MATSDEYVLRGIYVDYSRPWGSQTQYLCSNFVATVWTNSLSVLVTLAAARLFRLGHYLFAIGTGRPIHGMHSGPESVLRAYLVEHRADLPSHIHLGDVEINLTKKWKIPIIIILLGGAFLAILVVGFLTAKIVTGSSALSKHPACGIYEDNQIFGANRTANVSWVEAGYIQYKFDAEIESAAYAQKCYRPTTDPNDCNSYVQRSIPYTTSNAPCPFLDPSMCDLPGKTEAIHFSTGAVDSRILGLNAPRTLQFRRNATCTPIIVNDTFVAGASKGKRNRFQYYYGDYGNPYGLTYTSYAPDTSIWVPNEYLVYVKMLANWDRLPGLRTDFRSGLAMIFINQGLIYYPRPSLDPVFPTFREQEWEGRTWYYNPRYYSSILGCVDTIEFKIPYQSDLWYNYSDLHSYALSFENTQERGTALLLERALMISSTGESIFFRREDGLLARKLVVGHVSSSLAEEQWKEESRNLFETSLARIQLDTKLMATGALATYNGTRRVPGQDESICDRTFLFQSRKSQNINLAALIWITVVSLIIMTLAVPLKDDRLVADWLWTTALSPCGHAIKEAYRIVKREAPPVIKRLKDSLPTKWKYRRRTRQA